MGKGAYYNEFDPKAAARLRDLIRRGLIADGDVDERSIVDVDPEDLRGFAQHHFFAGIGGWSLALRTAGWPDQRPVMTGSCPCQPFSAAGKRKGTTDERHLWPALARIIDVLAPGVFLGEQVSSPDGRAWFDIVSADLERMGYATGANDSCAASVGAPHIRQRLYFVGVRLADADNAIRWAGRPRGDFASGQDSRRSESAGHARIGGARSRLEHADSAGFREGCGGPAPLGQRCPDGPASGSGRLANSDGRHPGPEREQPGRQHGLESQDGRFVERLADSDGQGLERRFVDGGGRADQRFAGTHSLADPRVAIGVPGPTNGFWRDVDWLFCRGGWWRPVEPGTFPLVDGVPNRVDLLRQFGNAIVIPHAAAFIESVDDVLAFDFQHLVDLVNL